MRRAAIYARISKDPTGNELGVRRQEADCRALCERLGIDIGAVFVDDNISASVGKPRPAYDRMMADLSAGAFDTIVAWHPDRLTRHPRELEDLIDTLKAAGATVQTVMAGEYDLATASGQTVARIVGAIAKGESLQKSERLRRKHEELAQRGRNSGGGTRPFGFEADRVTLRKSEVKIVRELARRVMAGESLRSLAIDLDRRAVPTVSGGRWSTQVLRHLLMSGRIAGLREHRTGTFTAQWPAIISVDDHRRVVAILSDGDRALRRRPAGRYLLTGGLGVCGLCGTALVARPRGDGHKAIVCASGPNFHGCGKIRALSDPEAGVVDGKFRTVDELVIRAVIERVDSPQFSTMAAPTDGDDDDDRALEALARVDQRLQELAAMWAAGDLDRPSWAAARRHLETERQSLNNVIRRGARRQAIATVQRSGTLREAWPDMNLDQRRAAIAAVIDAVVIGPAVKGRNFFDPDRVSIRWKA
jgi:DNA invertase Pin-like site-specific DNA recombinase